MTLRSFLDAAVSILVEEYMKTGQSIFEALDAVREWSQGDGKPLATPTVSSSTADSLAQLNALMKDVR